MTSVKELFGWWDKDNNPKIKCGIIYPTLGYGY